jgi:hypothetical protein
MRVPHSVANECLKAASPDLFEALRDLLRHYVDLVHSGDAGNWNPETEIVVKDARSALSRALGEGEGKQEVRAARNSGTTLGATPKSAPTDAVSPVLADLLARVEGAEGADREIDADLEVALYQPKPWRPECHRAPNAGLCTVTVYVDGQSGKRTYGTSAARHLTGSVDEALALVERALPGWRWQIMKPGTRFEAFVQQPAWSLQFIDATGATPALALIAAMLRALIAGGDESAPGTHEPPVAATSVAVAPLQQREED